MFLSYLQDQLHRRENCVVTQGPTLRRDSDLGLIPLEIVNNFSLNVHLVSEVLWEDKTCA